MCEIGKDVLSSGNNMQMSESLQECVCGSEASQVKAGRNRCDVSRYIMPRHLGCIEGCV